MSLPTIEEIEKIQAVIKGLEGPTQKWPIEITVTNRKPEYGCPLWFGTDVMTVKSDSLDDLPDRCADAISRRDPAKEIREKAAKLGFDLVERRPA